MRIACVVKGFGYLALGAVAAVLSASCDGGSASSKAAFNQADSSHMIGYMLGQDMGKTVMGMKAATGVEFDKGAFLLALKDVLDSVPSRLSDSALKAVDEHLKEKINAQRVEKRRQFEEDNLKAANAFLEENKGKEGVVVTPSGLQYVVLTEGKGPKPTLKDKVKVHYHGTLPDGKVFDSSVERGSPIVFPVEGVIKGWTEVLQLMSVGSKYKVAVPPDLAYGKEPPRGSPIGPNAVLIFEIELLGIEK